MSVERKFSATTYQATVAKLIRGLETQRIPYMVVGGLSAAYYGIPRATFDIDLVVAVEPLALGALVTLLRREGFDLTPADAQLLLKVSNSISTTTHRGLRLDLWLIKSEYDRVAFGRRRRASLWGRQRVWMVAPEDSVLSKLIAGRTRDFEDVIGVLAEQHGKLDWTYMNSWARRLELTKALARVRKKQL